MSTDRPAQARSPSRPVVIIAGLGLWLAGCSLAPPYVKPTLNAPIPESYKEIGPWTPASPADAQPRGAWWAVYGDKTLDDLEQRIEHDNPDLAAALARYDQARGLAAQTRAAQFPEVDLTGSKTFNGQSLRRPLRVGGPGTFDDNALGAVVSYELDLWGRVRNLVAAGKAQAEASGADAATVRLSLQAQLADAYVNLRGLDAQARLLADTTAAYARALALTQAQYSGGAAPGIDVARAEAQLETARAQEADVAAQRALFEHQIASLIGVPASSFAISPDAQLPDPQRTPVTAPSVLLQRRPDIAAAERRVFAADAGIGVARAAYFPTLTLDASAGFETAGGVNLLNVSNGFWSLGPSLVTALFDGGRRKAGVDIARAQFDEASANYRSVVLAAFQQVEDNLALSNRLADEARSDAAAVKAAQRAEQLSLVQYRMGAVTYLDVVVAQTADLEAERAALSTATRRLLASVDLVRALGGGWLASADVTSPSGNVR